jgi:hypothetical protein
MFTLPLATYTWDELDNIVPPGAALTEILYCMILRNKPTPREWLNGGVIYEFTVNGTLA